MKKTGKIRYNVQQRGREHRGKDRHFDLRALQSLINSPAVQEQVKNRDMLGYYGHVVRAKFGLTPPETVIWDGKAVAIEPALVTTHLFADADGNIEHETEFLDTASGKLAERMYASKAGGFSSAIHALPRGTVDIPTVFAGFDFVFEPNYTTNRGYLFDSAGMDAGLILDSILSEQQHGITAMNAIYDSLQADHLLAMQTIQRLAEENEELLSMAVRGGASGAAVLDGVDLVMKPMVSDDSATRAFRHNAASFRHAKLPGFAALDSADERDADMEKIARHYGVRK